MRICASGGWGGVVDTMAGGLTSGCVIGLKPLFEVVLSPLMQSLILSIKSRCRDLLMEFKSIYHQATLETIKINR